MQKNRKRTVLLLAFFIMLMTAATAVAAEPAYSGFWYQDGTGNWHIRDGQGNPIKNAWVCDDAVASNGKDVWYLIDASGNMVAAGLVQDGTGNYYSLEMNHEGHFGMLRYASKTYTADGLTVSLTLESSHNGSFAAIRNGDGLAALKAKYGVTQVSIDNSNCVYTSSFGGAAGQNSTAPAAQGGTLTAADFIVTGTSVPAADMIAYTAAQYPHDAATYYYYSSSQDSSRESVVRTARGITLASTRNDVIAAYGSGKEVNVSDPAGTRVIRIAHAYDPAGVKNYIRSCLAYFTDDGKYAIYFAFKDNGQLSFIFYYVV